MSALSAWGHPLISMAMTLIAFNNTDCIRPYNAYPMLSGRLDMNFGCKEIYRRDHNEDYTFRPESFHAEPGPVGFSTEIKSGYQCL